MRLGFGEILLILVLVLLFFGASRLPQVGAGLGEAIKGLKKGLQSINEDETAQPPQSPPPTPKAPPSAQA